MWAGPELIPRHLPGVKELREQIEIIAVALGWLLAVAKTCIEYTHSRLSIASRRNKELHRAGELVGFLAQLSTARLPEEQSHALHNEAQVSLQEILQDIEKLNTRLSTLDKDPNSRLNVAQKMFLLFRPRGLQSITLLVLTYAAFIGGITVVLIRHASWHLGYILEVSTAFLLAGLFHHWALEERRRILGAARRTNGRFFFIHAPQSIRVFLAQLAFLFNCLLLIGLISSQIFTHPFKSFTGFMVPLAYFAISAFIFYAWGRAELWFFNEKPELLPFHIALGSLRRSLLGTLTVLFAFPITASSMLLTLGVVVNLVTDHKRFFGFALILIITLSMTVLPLYGAIRTGKIEGFRKRAAMAVDSAPEALATSA